MSGICGWLGEGDPAWLDLMLSAIDYRGDATDRFLAPWCGLGARFFRDRPGCAQGVFVAADEARTVLAGSLAPIVAQPAEVLDALLRREDFAALDGAFAAARIDPEPRELTLVRDPFGVRSLYYVEHRGCFVFASELKQLLAIPELPVAVEASVLHAYLTFSFVPGERVPLEGVRRLLPGQLLHARAGGVRTRSWFELREEHDPERRITEQAEAVRELRLLGKAAVRKRISAAEPVGLYLSGGLDSSAVAFWLTHAGANVHAFSLNFGGASVERAQAREVAAHLGLPITWVEVDGAAVADIVPELVHRLDLPFGDAVTGPQYLLGRAADAQGRKVVFNGEGGDQLFGGWTSKPMIAAAVYSGVFDEASDEERYLRSYHRFYGLEERLYTPELSARVGGPGQRRSLLRPYLGAERAESFLNRVRLADLSLKGSQNILPRAERIAGGLGLDVRVPLFDRALAEASFRFAPQLKLHGACEKYVFKLAMQGRLPEPIVWRRKFGMSVPITDWLLGSRDGRIKPSLAAVLEDYLGDASVTRRGLFRVEYVRELKRGCDEPFETRRRRIGEKLWALLMLEAWLRTFVDRRGKLS